MGETLSVEYGPEFQKPGEACGVFGIYSPNSPVATYTYEALLYLQHRGHESAGVAVNDLNLTIVKDEGKVPVALQEGRLLRGLNDSSIAIGHVRYGTQEKVDAFKAAQPAEYTTSYGRLALGHNGHIKNAEWLISHFDLYDDPTITDSHVLTSAIGKMWEKLGDLDRAVKEVLPKLEGAFSIVAMTHDRLLAIRDQYGFRPLNIGKSTDGYVIASELTALKKGGRAEFVREVEPGEVINISAEGLSAYNWAENTNPRVCAFEFVYFSRPDNVIGGENVKSVRERMGMHLAAISHVDADIVIDAPESGRQAALGFSHGSRIPYDVGFIKTEGIGRTFIEPDQDVRDSKIDMKLNVNEEVIADRSLVLVDDSIVRGTTTRKLVRMLKDAGAREVHLRISSAPYQWPCFYGMDTGKKDELLAANMTVEQMRTYIGADSLVFLTPEDVRKSVGSLAGKLCMACMTGRYPD